MRIHPKRLIVTSALLVSVGIVITGRSGGAANVLGQGYTNAPGEGNCSQCHSGGTYGTVTPSIQIFQLGTQTPVTSYTPGTSYDMRVTVNNTSGSPLRYGFQLTALRTSGNQALGGFSNLGANIQQLVVSGRTYVEHSSATVSNQYNFRWTAPASGSGAVRFYASGNCVNNNSNSSGDVAGSAFIQINELVPLSVSGTKVNVLCKGASTGSINITALGGTAPYGYSWSDGSTAEDRSGLAAGTYSVIVSDNAGGTANASFIITEPATSISISVGFQPILCNGGTTDVTVTGSGGTGTITGTGLFPTTAGPETFTVSDQNGCTADTSITITQPAPILGSATSNGPLPCDGSGTTVTVTASGGTGVLAGTGTFNTNQAGPQEFTVIDDNACSVDFQVIIDTLEHPSVSINQITDAVGGADGAIDINVSGGQSPYAYLWSNNQTTQDISGLAPGTYSVVVTDDNDCETGLSDIIVLDNIGIEELSQLGGVYPNPFNGSFYLKHPHSKVLSVLDASGRPVSFWVSENQVVLDHFVSGWYYIELETPSGRIKIKLSGTN